MTMSNRHRHSSSDASAGVRPPDSDMPGRGPPDKSEPSLASSGFFPRRRYWLEGGHAYMVHERKPDRALSFTKQAVKGGFQSLIVSRSHPRHTSIGAPSESIWLANTLGEGILPPANLEGLWKRLAYFLETHKPGVIFFDGIEYLVLHNDFLMVFAFLEQLYETVVKTDGILIVSLDERAFDSNELALVERNFINLTGRGNLALFIPRMGHLLDECRALRAEVGLTWTTIEDSSRSFEEKLNKARREEVPFVVVVEGGELTLRTLHVI